MHISITDSHSQCIFPTLFIFNHALSIHFCSYADDSYPYLAVLCHIPRQTRKGITHYNILLDHL